MHPPSCSCTACGCAATASCAVGDCAATADCAVGNCIAVAALAPVADSVQRLGSILQEVSLLFLAFCLYNFSDSIYSTYFI